jgi:uncharacterized protein HemY
VAGFDSAASEKRRAGPDEEIYDMMRRILNGKNDDEKMCEDLERQLEDAREKLELLEARKKRRDDDLECLLGYLGQDCRHWSKRAKR